MNRREVLRAGAAFGTGAWLLLADADATAGAGDATWRVSAWLGFDARGVARVSVHKSEMGQGVLTALPMLIAEELALPLAQLHVTLAPAADGFRDARGNQTTGYSSSVSSSWVAFRRLGATARILLEQAAAMHWGVPVEAVRAIDGRVLHPASGRSLPYRRLLRRAQSLPLPAEVPLRSRDQFTVIGTRPPRIDVPAKVDGSDRFGIDVRLPGMRYATLVRAPDRRSAPLRVDSSGALACRGVERVVTLSRGVAVLARDSHAALCGASALQIDWPASSVDSDGFAARLRTELAAADAARALPASAAEAAAPRHESLYEQPLLAHAALEPLACSVQLRPGRCDIWVGTQAPSRVQDLVANLLGLPRERVEVHTMPIGGSFGRRGETDFVAEAVELAQRVDGPVQLFWSRADDLQHDFYRPMTLERLRATLAPDGRPQLLEHRIVGPSVARRRSPALLLDGSDILLTQGSSDMRYAVPLRRVDHVEVDLGVPVGFWRSVGHSHTAFALESFMDELAHAARTDPLAYRLALLADEPRLARVLEDAARRAEWSRPRPPGTALGIACMESYGSFVAQVAEVEVADAAAHVRRVWCSVDCGICVHPGIVEQQMEGAIVFGLSAALHGEITLRGGRVVQSNYHDYPVLRIDAVPRVDVAVLASEAEPGGAGEPATPVIAPAVANAIFAATGQRLRRLPLRLA